MQKFLWILFLALPLFVLGQDKKPDASLDWERFFMPGVGYSSFIPQQNIDSLGLFHGINAQIVIFSIGSSDKDSPGYLRIEGRYSQLGSSKKGGENLSYWGFSLLGSFERGIRRHFMVPYYGLELGGISRSSAEQGFQFSPIVGCNIYQAERFLVHIQAQYPYVNNKEFDQYSGLQLQAGVSVAVW